MLIEVVLALLLAGMVVSVTTVVAVQSVQVRRSLESQLTRRWERFELLDRFERDVDQAIWWLPETAKPLMFPDEPDRLIEIIGLVDAPSMDSMFRRRLPARIIYRLEGDPNEIGGRRLVREVLDLTVSGAAPRRSIAADGLSDAVVQGFVGGSWQSRPQGHGGKDVSPKAFRLVCRWQRAGEADAIGTVLIGDWR